MGLESDGRGEEGWGGGLRETGEFIVFPRLGVHSSGLVIDVDVRW
jgi:hypothetical protein